MIAFERGGAIWTVEPDGTGVRQLTRPPTGVGHSDPVWSPDGTRLAFTRGVSGAGEGSGVYTVNADNSGLHRIAADGNDPTWSPDGSYIAFTRGRWDPDLYTVSDLWVVGSDGNGEKRILTAYGSPDAGTSGIGVGADESAWSPAGAPIIFIATPFEADDTWMHLIRPDGSDEHVLRTEPGVSDVDNDTQPSWSPDGAHLAYTRSRGADYAGVDVDSSPTPTVATIDADGANLRVVAPGIPPTGGSGSAWNADPAWSPDGRFIVYLHVSTLTPDETGLWVMNADGSGKHFLVANADQPDWQPIPAPTPTPPAPVVPQTPATPSGTTAQSPVTAPLTVSASGARRVRAGALLRVRVTFSAAHDRTPVRLEHRVGRRWALIRSRVVSGSSMVFSVRLTRLGVHRFRVVYLVSGVRRLIPLSPVRVVGSP